MNSSGFLGPRTPGICGRRTNPRQRRSLPKGEERKNIRQIESTLLNVPEFPLGNPKRALTTGWIDVASLADLMPFKARLRSPFPAPLATSRRRGALRRKSRILSAGKKPSLVLCDSWAGRSCACRWAGLWIFLDCPGEPGSREATGTIHCWSSNLCDRWRTEALGAKHIPVFKMQMQMVQRCAKFRFHTFFVSQTLPEIRLNHGDVDGMNQTLRKLLVGAGPQNSFPPTPGTIHIEPDGMDLWNMIFLYNPWLSACNMWVTPKISNFHVSGLPRRIRASRTRGPGNCRPRRRGSRCTARCSPYLSVWRSRSRSRRRVCRASDHGLCRSCSPKKEDSYHRQINTSQDRSMYIIQALMFSPTVPTDFRTDCSQVRGSKTQRIASVCECSYEV